MKLKNIILLIALFSGLFTYTQSFEDRPSNETDGDFPKKWDLIKGSAQIGTFEGEKVLLIANKGIITPLLNSKNYLADEFTLEFDGYFDTVTHSIDYQYYDIRFWDGAGKDPIRIYRHGVSVVGKAGSKVIDKNLEGKSGTWRFIAIHYKRGSLKVFIDGKQILNLPRFNFKPQMISIGGIAKEYETNFVRAIKNVRLIGIENTNNTPAVTNISINPIETIENTNILTDIMNTNNNEQKNDIIRICTTSDNLIYPELEDTITHSEEGTKQNALVSAPNILWPNGATLKVSFLDEASDFVKERIVNYAKVWEDYANISFKFIDTSDGDIRIGFKKGGSWSWVGTLAQGVKSDEKTMNFGWLDDYISENEFSRTVIHEFGHALGLKHEHQHPDGDICWNWEAVIDFYTGDPNNWSKEETRSNLESLSYYSIGNSTAYDPQSIMHYPIPQSLTSCNYMTGWNTDLSDLDKTAIATMYPFRKKRHIVGPNTFSYNWTSGWNSVETFKVSNSNYLFLLKENTGDIHIHEFNNDGSVGKRVYDQKWSVGLTIAQFYEINGQTFLFLLKKATGNIYIHKINSDGTIGARISQKLWSAGWSKAQFYEINEQSFLFLIKNPQGDADVYKIKNDGTVGDLIFTEKWTSGWTTTEVFKSNNQLYLFLLKNRTGDIHIHKINNNGTIGSQVYQNKWSTGWSTAEFYETNNQTYLFLLKEANGEVHQNYITSGGTVGSSIYNNKGSWTSGWTTAEFYQAGRDNYMFLLKKKDGTVHVHKIW